MSFLTRLEAFMVTRITSGMKTAPDFIYHRENHFLRPAYFKAERSKQMLHFQIIVLTQRICNGFPHVAASLKKESAAIPTAGRKGLN